MLMEAKMHTKPGQLIIAKQDRYVKLEIQFLDRYIQWYRYIDR